MLKAVRPVAIRLGQSFVAVFLVGTLDSRPAAAERPGADALTRRPGTVVPSRRTDPHFLQRHKQMLLRKSAGPIDVLFLGDSITKRWDRDLWHARFGKWHPANFGVDGDRTQHVLWRITEGGELEGVRPRLIVLLIGVNNVSYDPAEDIVAGITAIVAELRQRLPMSRVLLLGVFPVGAGPNVYRDRLKLVNVLISQLADGKMVRFLDFGKRFLEPDRSLSKDIMPDLLHLSPKGYAIFADAVEPVITEMLDQGTSGGR